MASRAIAVAPQQQQQQQQPPPKEGNKIKIIQAEGRNRRVLQDIGNLVIGKAPEGKANAAVEKKKKSIIDAAKKIAIETKALEKPKSDTVIVKSSGKDEKFKYISRRQLRDGISRKNVKAFTSVLSTRSKAASGKPKDPVVNIDESDADNELAVVEYIDEIYKFYKLSENESQVRDYMGLQPDISAKMRSILVDWLIEVHHKFELVPETLYLTINIVDRFLSMKVVQRKELQLVGISSMLLACKYEEIWAPEVNDFVCISDKAYAKEQILVMEKAILGKLGWNLTVSTPYVFLVRYIKASVPADEKMENMAFFLAELGLMNYSAMTMYSPSIIAASAVYAARHTLERSPFWTETLKHHTGYCEDQLMDCAKLLVSLHSEAADSKLKAVYKKFSNTEHHAVAVLSPAKSFITSPISALSV